MSIDSTRAQIIARVWQAVAQSGVDLSSVSQAQQEVLVNKIADQMLFTLNDLLDEIPQPAPEQEPQSAAKTSLDSSHDEYREEILWRGRPFLSLVENYTITSDRITMVRGLLSKDIENFELVRIQDIDFDRSVGDRLLGLGDIEIRGADPSQSHITLRNISDPEAVYELLRKAWLAARKRQGLQFREYM